jgi:hypothetical protein
MNKKNGSLTGIFVMIIVQNKFKFLTFFSVFCAGIIAETSFAQSFPPAPGFSGTTAIHKDSSLIVDWATSVSVQRGWLDISDKALGLASFGEDNNGVGPAEGNSIDIVSLGDSGIAILTFTRPIRDEEGPDFAVFENGFADNYLELAFVEVSSNGVDFVRFPTISEVPTVQQIGPFEFSDCRYIHNLAGKYRQGYGTPFDLAELQSNSALDISAITHVKIIDVIGSINDSWGSPDSQGTMINDLFPTPFESGGFDLDAVAVIHQQAATIEELETTWTIFPNPTTGIITLQVSEQSELRILDGTGNELFSESIFTSFDCDLNLFGRAVYFMELTNATGRSMKKVVLIP